MRPPGWDENDPANSFQFPLAEFSGLHDATENRVSVVFSILAFYYRLYLDEVVPTTNERLAIEVAMSRELERWLQENATHVFEASQ